jgi:hypothetical protein
VRGHFDHDRRFDREAVPFWLRPQRLRLL